MIQFYLTMAICLPLLAVLLGKFALEMVRRIIPYQVFKLHAKLVMKGHYRIERKDHCFYVKAGGTNVRVAKWSSYKEQVEFDVGGGFTDFFKVNYDLTKQTLEGFTCSEKFAKTMNQEAFMTILENYIPAIIEKEYGVKSDRVKVVEKMKAFGESFGQKTKKKTEKSVSPLPSAFRFAEIEQLVETINQLSKDLTEKNDALEWEQQHQLESLMERRLPRLLMYADNLVYKEEIRQSLNDVVHMLENWKEERVTNHSNEVEKELLLIKKMTSTK